MTQRAYNVIFAGLVLAVIGLTLGSALLLRGGICLLLLFLFTFAGMIHAYITANVCRDVQSTTVTRGQSTREMLAFRFQSLLPLGAAVLRYGDGRSVRFGTNPFQKSVTNLERPCDHTGVYPETDADLLLTDMFNFFIFKKKIRGGGGTLTVLPVSYTAEKPALKTRESADKTSNSADDSTELSALRQWMEGDFLRRVHWKLTAKNFVSGALDPKPIVKTFEEAARPYTLIAADMSALDAVEETTLSLMDGVREAVLALANAVTEDGDRAKLLLCGDHSTEVDADGDTSACALLLACTQFEGRMDVPALAEEIMRRRDTSGAVVLVTTRLNAEIADMLLRVRNGFLLSVSLVYVTDMESQEASRLLLRLESSDIPVKKVLACASEAKYD